MCGGYHSVTAFISAKIRKISRTNNRTSFTISTRTQLTSLLTLSSLPPWTPFSVYCPTINVADAVKIPPPEAVAVALHPVVTVMVSVGMTQPVVQVGQTFLVTVEVDVVGQQSVLSARLE